jgi:hypothetical protein
MKVKSGQDCAGRKNALRREGRRGLSVCGTIEEGPPRTPRRSREEGKRNDFNGGAIIGRFPFLSFVSFPVKRTRLDLEHAALDE